MKRKYYNYTESFISIKESIIIKQKVLKKVLFLQKKVLFPYRKVLWFKVKVLWCFVQSCLFVQCWPGIFLVQCRENLCNVCPAFAATGYYKKINRFKIKTAENLCYSDDIALDLFQYNVVWSLLGNIAQGFCLCNVARRVFWHY